MLHFWTKEEKKKKLILFSTQLNWDQIKVFNLVTLEIQFNISCSFYIQYFYKVFCFCFHYFICLKQ